MAAPRIKLNLAGLEEVATSGPTRAAVSAAAEAVAANVRALGVYVEGEPGDVALPVEMKAETTTDMRVNRAKARVTLAHPAGLAVQAKHGALTQAASAAGLRVRGG